MADNFDAQARLRISVEGLNELINEMERAVQSGNNIDRVWEKLQSALKNTGSSAKGAADGLKQAGDAAGKAAATGWTALEKKVKGVADAYKEAAREAAAAGKAAPNASAFMADRGLSGEDLSRYGQGRSANFFDAAGINGAEAALPRLRYALYDVATTAGIASTAITGVGVASVAAYASMESSFTAVERTSGVVGGEVEKLRGELVALTREIPQSFGDIADIAARGAQLGIAKDELSDFTETVAQFVATSDTVSLDQAVEAFGRISNLMGDKDFTALGSAITLVGVNAAATEGQIVKTTQELAPFATAVGMSSDEVIGLAAAVASLGQPPERARSAFLTLQRVMDTAVSEGSEKLDAFAALLGKTADETAKLWKQDPGQFTSAFATALGSAKDLTATFDELGINERRAVQVFQALAADARNAGEGMSVLDRAFADANQGYSEGTELARQYALILDDLASRWQIFLNAVQEAGAAVGAALAPAIGLVLANLTDMIQAFSAFANHPIGKVVIGLVAALGVAGGALLGLVATAALGTASMAAMATAMGEMTVASAGSTLGFRALGAAATELGIKLGISAGAMHAFKIALISTGVGAAVVLIGTLIAGIVNATSAAKGFTAEARQMGDALNRAIAADTKAHFEDGAEAIAVYTRELKKTGGETDKAAQVAADYAGVQSKVGSSVDDTTKKLEEQTVALGKNSEEYFRNQLLQDDDFDKMANDPRLRAAAESAGFTVSELIASGMKQQGGFAEYVKQIEAEADRLRLAVPTDTTQWDETTFAMIEQRDALYDLADAWRPYAEAQDKTRAAAEAAAVTAEYAGVAVTDAGDAADDASGDMASFADGLYEAQTAAIATENQLFSLGSTLGENAGQWDLYSEAGRGNLSALYQWMTAVAGQTGATTSGTAANFAAMYQALIEGGVATANQLLFLRDAAASLAGMKFENIKPATTNFANLFNGISAGAARAAKAVGGGGGRGGKGSVAEAVRTLIDYGRDLEGVFKRAFDIRYGDQSALDDVTSGWRKIAEAADKAREAAEEHRRALAEMGADRSIKQYWLSVAENYGDELRAAKLREELAKIDADMAKKKKDLTKEQEKENKSLTGNSDAAIKNRDTILDMVGSYQDLLTTYAKNGMSQADLKRKSEQLKQEFIRQATQAGYSKTEILKYAKSFDDMAYAINKVPRNITVKANIDPAKQALAEFEARAQKAGKNASKSIRTGGGGGYKIPPISAPVPSTNTSRWKDLGYKAGRAMRSGLINGISVIKIGNKTLFPSGTEPELFGRKDGGYTGNAGVNQITGFHHGQEFVMSAPAVRTLGVNGMNYMHNMLKSGRIPTLGGGSGVGLVDLSDSSIRAISAALAGQLTLVLPPTQIAGSVGAHNVASGFQGRA